MIINGTIHKYGDNINTDVIIPARYANIVDCHELAKYCMEDLDKEFIKKVAVGDILVGGYNFGCGSSREIAPIAISYSGIAVVIAKSFARIFFRNAINIGLYVIESAELVDSLIDGEHLEMAINDGEIINISSGRKFNINQNISICNDIISHGGLVNYINNVKLK